MSDDEFTDTVCTSFSSNFIDVFRANFGILSLTRKHSYEMNKISIVLELMNDLMNVGLPFIHFVQ